MDEKIIEADNYQQKFLHKFLKKKFIKKIDAIKTQISKYPERLDELNKEIMFLEEQFKEELKLVSNIDDYELNTDIKARNYCEKNLNSGEIQLLEFFDTLSLKFSSDNLNNDFNKRLNKINKFIEKSYSMNFKSFLNSEKMPIGKYYLPTFLYKFLFEFQRDGVLFLQKRNVLLADEMGLGKTIQVISLLACLYMDNTLSEALIITPVSVLNQWVKEIYNFFPFFRVLVYHNSYEHFNSDLIIGKHFNTIIITSYETFLGSSKNFYNKNFDVLILDEAHKIKNNKTKIFKSVNLIETKSRLMMTGTPIQNNLKELWSLFNFIRPEILGNQVEFEHNYNIKSSCESGKLNKDSHLMLIYIKELIKPYILRREKKMLQHELPPKHEKIVLCPMTEYQEILYEEELERQKKKFEENRKNKLNGDQIIKGSFGCIFNLRRICNHPQFEKKVEELTPKDLENISQNRVGKFEVMKCLLKKFYKEKRKTLIFTQTIKMMDFIAAYLKDQNLKYERIEGKVSLNEREKAIRTFRESNICNIMLLTTRVGCLGLNLIMASRLIIYDPDWNPSIDKQARERIFRFGQNRDVETYLLLSMGTLEEKIYQKQLFKTLLSNDILSDQNIKDLETEMKNLLSYKRLNAYERNKGLIEDVKGEENNKRMISGKELIEFIRYREAKFK